MYVCLYVYLDIYLCVVIYTGVFVSFYVCVSHVSVKTLDGI